MVRQGRKAAGVKESGLVDNLLTEVRQRAQRSRSTFLKSRIFFWIQREMQGGSGELLLHVDSKSVLIDCRKKGTRLICKAAGGDYLERIHLTQNLSPQKVLSQNWK